jgi:kynurenine formamidase
MTAAEFRALFRSVSNWGRWGHQAHRGTLNCLTPDQVAAACRLVESGVSVSMSLPLSTRKRGDNPVPADHRMTMLPSDGSGSVRFAKDYVGGDFHNDGHSHLDALCHVGFDGSLYDGLPAGSVTSAGAETLTVGVLDRGLVGRAVLLDVPRQRRTRWIEPGEYLFREDLEAAERHQGVQVGPGDVLLVRTGHARRLDELGPWDTTVSKAGLHPTAATFLAERQVAAMGSDGNNDTIPSAIEGVPYPIHVLAINAMGVHLLDYLRFEDLARHCERSARWTFLFVAAPLRIPGGTGSPVNPIAIF